MPSLSEILRRTKVLTFDCYGTLIDWDAGLWGSLRTVFPSLAEDRRPELFDAYVEVEAEIESGPYLPYREVLALTTERLAQRLRLPLPPEGRRTLADTLPQWRPFADTGEALTRLQEHFRLGVLSNIDRDLFTGTARQFPITFDFVVTAQDVRSYKPALGHFHRFLREHGADGPSIHVAQSLYHDGRPARELDLAFIWINRYKQTNDTAAAPVAEFPDLRGLADAADAMEP